MRRRFINSALNKRDCGIPQQYLPNGTRIRRTNQLQLFTNVQFIKSHRQLRKISCKYFAIARAICLIKSFKTQEADNNAIYEECLRILSYNFAKQLPPFDWCFLQELMHQPQLRNYSITIAARQVSLSNTARGLIDNLLLALTNDAVTFEDIEIIYKNLTFLCNSIQPSVLEPFLKNTLTKIIESNNETLFLHLNAVLTDANIADVNKNVITKLLYDFAMRLNSNTRICQVIINTIATVPDVNKFKETQLSEKYLKIATQVICNKAKREELGNLNEILDACSKKKE